MKIHDLLLPAAVLGGAALLLLPVTSHGFTTLGGTLDLSQRGFRVYNNFSDPSANANQTPHVRFPGATGATLAIWKAVVEWGSELHGDGFGDPTQPGGLGSGGANFDAHFRGLATSPGGTNDNTFSQISGPAAGVLAFTELPIKDGWRIRFYESPWVWHDGPGLPPAIDNAKDIQGVATHEYGHALGLNHSFLGTTMQASASGNLVNLRSLHADDQAGVQYLYGVRSPHKPRVTHYTLSAGQVVVEGENFAPTGNDVWFTRATAGAGDGAPLLTANLSSTDGGTRIVATLPADAGPGNLMVRVPGEGGDALSNAFPFDPLLDYCKPPVRYGTPKAGSGGSPTLTSSGTPSAHWNDLRIGAMGAPAGALGILFSGPAPASQPFAGGTLLVGGPFARERMFQTDFFGDVELELPVDLALVGATRYFQMWFQDPGASFGVGLSDAFEITFCP